MAKRKPKQTPADKCGNCRFGRTHRENQVRCRLNPETCNKEEGEWCGQYERTQTEEQITE